MCIKVTIRRKDEAFDIKYPRPRKMSTTDTCINGHWEEGVCVCDQGYELGFSDLELSPSYCENRMITIIYKTPFIESEAFIHIITMALTVAVAAYCLVAVLGFVVSVAEAYLTHRQIKNMLNLLQIEIKEIEEYEQHKLLHADIWDPPGNMKCVAKTKEPKRAVGDKGATQIYTAKVIHPYKATSPGELNLRMGDTIKDVTMLQGGWCKGSLDNKIGIFPAGFVKLVENTTKSSAPRDQ